MAKKSADWKNGHIDQLTDKFATIQMPTIPNEHATDVFKIWCVTQVEGSWGPSKREI